MNSFSIEVLGYLMLSLVLGSLFIPKLMDWSTIIQPLSLLFRQLFWNYAFYIAMTNSFLGLVSIFASDELLNGTMLSCFLTGFIALYWWIRLLLQLFIFDIENAPKGFIYTIGEWALTSLFVLFSITYSYLFYLNLML